MMNEINYVQLNDEAINILNFDAKARRGGGNKLKNAGNCFGLTLKYLFAMKGLSYRDVGARMDVTAQTINHLVNRSPESSFNDIFYLKKLCSRTNIDYQYFMDLARTVKEMM